MIENKIDCGMRDAYHSQWNVLSGIRSHDMHIAVNFLASSLRGLQQFKRIDASSLQRLNDFVIILSGAFSSSSLRGTFTGPLMSLGCDNAR